jgi:hypothetical protein
VREFVDPISISPPDDPISNHKSRLRLWVEESSLYLSFNRLLYVLSHVCGVAVNVANMGRQGILVFY